MSLSHSGGRRRTSRLLALLLLPALAFAIAGCGGSGSGGSQTPSRQVISPSGGSFSSGNAALSVPANAVSQPTVISIQSTSLGLPRPGNLTYINNTAYSFSPNGMTFSQPVTLTLTYSDSDVPQGISANSLKLYTVTNGVWQVVPNSTVDTGAKTVSAPITQFGLYAILAGP